MMNGRCCRRSTYQEAGREQDKQKQPSNKIISFKVALLCATLPTNAWPFQSVQRPAGASGLKFEANGRTYIGLIHPGVAGGRHGTVGVEKGGKPF